MPYQQKMIDVSRHNGEIDWKKVKDAGYHAIIRCGYGQDLILQDDARFEYNVSQCEILGIPYGVYLYSYADTIDGAKSEANHALRLVRDYCGDMLVYPIFVDVEEDHCRTHFAEVARAFCDRITASGYKAGIYSYASAFDDYMRDIDFGALGLCKWVAHWGVSSCSEECDIWQYTDRGSVPGISGHVDLNYCFTDFAGCTESEEDMQIGETAKADVIDFLTYKTLCDAYGSGDKRKNELGDFYTDVQAKINALLSAK